MAFLAIQLLGVVLVFIYLGIIPIDAELHRLHHQPKKDEILSFLGIGDWGRKGDYNQSQVALQVYALFSSILSHFQLYLLPSFYFDSIGFFYLYMF